MTRSTIVLSCEGTCFWARDADDPRCFAPGPTFLFALGSFLVQHKAPHLKYLDEEALGDIFWSVPDLPHLHDLDAVWSQDRETQDYLRTLREKALATA